MSVIGIFLGRITSTKQYPKGLTDDNLKEKKKQKKKQREGERERERETRKQR